MFENTLTAHQLQYGMRALLGMVTDLKALDGVLKLCWRTELPHSPSSVWIRTRIGAGSS